MKNDQQRKVSEKQEQQAGPPKLFPNLVKGVAIILTAIFEEGLYADKAIERSFKNMPKWGSRDRAFVAESVYEIVRWYRPLATLLGRNPSSELDWWRIFGIFYLIKGRELPHWEEFQGLNRDNLQDRYRDLCGLRKFRESIPDWIDELGEKELGEDWAKILPALNDPARVVIRVNRLKADIPELHALLLDEEVRTEPLNGDAMVVTERKNLFNTQAFKKGWFEIQDWSSQQVAPLLNVLPGMRVIDACAGAGGKTLHIAALMQNKGQIIALDTEAWKLDELRKRARRNGVDIIEARPVESTKTIKRLAGSADRLLIDAPCSGLGVLRRNPDAKWKLTPDFIDRVRQTQAELLESYSRMLKPGGKMVYATCSILPSENEKQVEAFMARHGDSFEWQESKTLAPHICGFDGFYLALLEKKKTE